MATHIPLFPTYNQVSLGENDAYLGLVDEYILDRRTQWTIDELIDKYGEVSYRELAVNKIVIRKTQGVVTLAFLISGSTSENILELVKNEPFSLIELMISLPQHLKLSSSELKNQLAFLYNFGKIQSFTTTATALTFVVSDGPDHSPEHPIEKALDRIYHFADRLEANLAYTVNQEATLGEFVKLV